VSIPRHGAPVPLGGLIFSQRHWEIVLKYANHFNGHRPHGSLAQRPPGPAPEAISADDEIPVHRTRLVGGSINEYRNTA
jgi:hypothetical protein